jgi:cytosine/adenosine deaminase-related metal-dependent hydrolase
VPLESADTLINNTMVVTMNPDRHVVTDASVVIKGDRIIAVGKTGDVAPRYQAAEVIDGQRFVVTPGMVNTHVHITGEPLTRGFVPENLEFDDLIFNWLTPMYAMYTEVEERLSAQLAAAEMLKSGTTSFLEAGTIKYVDAVVDGLVEIGIRARVGKWIWDLPDMFPELRQTTSEAIANLERTLSNHRHVAGGRIQAWSMLLGHTTCSDELWRAAAQSASRWETGMNFHMSHGPSDAQGFLANFSERPMTHLSKLGVLARHTVVAHAVHVDDEEISHLAHSKCSVAHCPGAALRCSIGVTQLGKVPEMVAAGINVSIGTDGNNASNFHDMMRATHLVAGLYKDARRNASMFPAEKAYEMATLGGARSIMAEDEIGSVEVGKKADLVLHDRLRPEWTPLLNVATQLVWSADGRSVHTVFVDGRKVVDNYRLTTIDEVALYKRAQTAGEAIIARSTLQDRASWPTI